MWQRDTSVPDGWTQRAKLVVPNPDPTFLGTFLGYGDSYVFDDGEVIAGSGATMNATGVAHVFALQLDGEAGWDYVEEIKPPGGRSGGWFEHNVAIVDDTLFLPAAYCCAGKGVVDQYHRNELGKWEYQMEFAASDSVAEDSFGHDIRVGGNTAVIGAPAA